MINVPKWSKQDNQLKLISLFEKFGHKQPDDWEFCRKYYNVNESQKGG